MVKCWQRRNWRTVRKCWPLPREESKTSSGKCSLFSSRRGQFWAWGCLSQDKGTVRIHHPLRETAGSAKGENIFNPLNSATNISIFFSRKEQELGDEGESPRWIRAGWRADVPYHPVHEKPSTVFIHADSTKWCIQSLPGREIHSKYKLILTVLFLRISTFGVWII